MWIDLAGSLVIAVGWVAVAAICLGNAAYLCWRGDFRDRAAQADQHDDLFRRGLGEYLKGAWFEAESLFGQLVAQNPRDVDARLTLATLLRHTGRPAEAERHLAELDRLEKAEKWREEIERERQLLKTSAEALIEPRSRANPLPDGVAQAA